MDVKELSLWDALHLGGAAHEVERVIKKAKKTKAKRVTPPDLGKPRKKLLLQFATPRKRRPQLGTPRKRRPYLSPNVRAIMRMRARFVRAANARQRIEARLAKG